MEERTMSGFFHDFGCTHDPCKCSGDSPVKTSGWIKISGPDVIDSKFISDTMSSKFTDIIAHGLKMASDPEYAAEYRRKQEMREDHPYFFRKLFPWTIKRWQPPGEDEY